MDDINPDIPIPVQERFARLARGESTELASFLVEGEIASNVDGTRIVNHFYSLALSGNGKVRDKAFAKFIADFVLEYAIPRSAILEAENYMLKTGSYKKLAKLHNEARGLFSSLDKSGEGGELILFVLAERILKIPQILCKMDIKTSTEMHFHGSDGLHIEVLAPDNRMALYFGESKLYKDLTDGIEECFSSLAPFLKGDGSSGSPEERDFQLLGRRVDLADKELESALASFLDPEHQNFNRLEFRGLTLVGFDSDAYPANTSQEEMDKASRKTKEIFQKIQTSLRKKCLKYKVTDIHIYSFFIPFPSVEAFRAALKTELGIE